MKRTCVGGGEWDAFSAESRRALRLEPRERKALKRRANRHELARCSCGPIEVAYE
jgi:hypothetical protein